MSGFHRAFVPFWVESGKGKYICLNYRSWSKPLICLLKGGSWDVTSASESCQTDQIFGGDSNGTQWEHQMRGLTRLCWAESCLETSLLHFSTLQLVNCFPAKEWKIEQRAEGLIQSILASKPILKLQLQRNLEYTHPSILYLEQKKTNSFSSKHIGGARQMHQSSENVGTTFWTNLSNWKYCGNDVLGRTEAFILSENCKHDLKIYSKWILSP